MESPASFFVFLGSLFREAENPAAPMTSELMPMRGLSMGIARSMTTQNPVAVIFDVSVAGFHVKFGATVEHLEKSTIETIEHKLAELSLLMAQVEGAARN
jgi:hypothetical protein